MADEVRTTYKVWNGSAWVVYWFVTSAAAVYETNYIDAANPGRKFVTQAQKTLLDITINTNGGIVVASDGTVEAPKIPSALIPTITASMLGGTDGTIPLAMIPVLDVAKIPDLSANYIKVSGGAGTDAKLTTPKLIGDVSLNTSDILTGVTLKHDLTAGAELFIIDNFNQVATKKLKFKGFGGGIDADGKKLINIANPTDNNDAANKYYVDLVAGYGFKPRDPVAAIATANIATRSGNQGASFDGAAPSTGERVLLVGQTDKSQNGVWLYNGAGAWTKVESEFGKGHTWFVERGNVNNDTVWIMQDDTGTIGLFSRVDTITAANGLYRTGNEIGIGPGGVTNDKVQSTGIDVLKIKAIDNAANKLNNSLLDVANLDWSTLSKTLSIVEATPVAADNGDVFGSLSTILGKLLKVIGGIRGVSYLSEGYVDTTNFNPATMNLKLLRTDVDTKQKKVTIGTVAPSTPAAGDIWFDTTV